MENNIKALPNNIADRTAVTGTQDGDKRGLDVFTLNPPNPVQAANLEIRNAGEPISALKLVYSFDANTVMLASSVGTINEARAFGVAITAANTNESMQIQTFGVLRDSSFTFPANDLLFVAANGSITNVAPITGYRTVIGTSQGIGSIFINIQETITL